MSTELINEMVSLYDEKQSAHLSRFFKTGQGQYGEGDRFLGIKVPVTRSLVKKYKNKLSIDEIEKVISSEWHEVRLAGFLLLLELYKTNIKKGDELEAKKIVDFYLLNLDKGNNWDLVDLVCQYILGDMVCRKPEKESILFDLAEREGYLWHQRVAIVSTFALIRSGRFQPTFQIAEKFFNHSHDLIHKATGWMLREIGKRGGSSELKDFLDKNKLRMPRTMLRYAIERFPEEERKKMLKK